MRIALPPAISIDAFAERDPTLPVVSLGGETMGTIWRVMFARPLRIDPAAIHTAIVARLAAFVAELSHWEPDSTLSQFNQAPAGHWLSLSPDFAKVVATALDIAEATDGAFDPTIGQLVDLWGFGPNGATPLPDAAAVEAAKRKSGWRRLAYSAETQRLRQPGGLSLDFSGIAKGQAVDVIADVLHAADVRHTLVEIGGEFAGRGIRPDGDPWWVELEIPPGTDIAPLRIALHDLTVATSGDYRRGQHSIDPRTARPASNGVVSTSVLHTQAMEADAWATALAVLGPVDGIALATRHSLAARIVTVAEDGVAREHLTPAFAAMLEE